MNSQKGFGLIGILIAVAVIAALAGGGLYWKETQKQKIFLQSGNDALQKAEELKTKIEQQNRQAVSETAAATSTQTSTNKVDTSKNLAPNGIDGWKTYRNEQYGFEVQYPADWSFDSDFDHNYGRVPKANEYPEYAGETRNLFQLHKDGPSQSSALDVEDLAFVQFKITGLDGIVEKWKTKSDLQQSLATLTPEQWVIFESSGMVSDKIIDNSVSINQFIGNVKTAYNNSNFKIPWGEMGGAYRILPSGRVMLINWERSNLDNDNDFSFQKYFLEILSTFKIIK
ncbi:prepilin-type N-terminal cleavage/methylation domain-containing protein [Patescibacteria group bacterium]|nr:prepilin-type N-terminal cleavage/methylation domain-containing protein [Patescibacteria group bacterium]